MSLITDPAPDLNAQVQPLAIQAILFKESALVLRAINHPLRQQILRLLHYQGELIVTDLYHRLHLEQSVASQHLAILRREKFVATRRQGKHIFYRVCPERLQQVHGLCTQLVAKKTTC